MLALRIALGLALAYVVLVILAWRFQERLAFPAPRAPVPDPQRVGVANGEQVELVSGDGTKLVGWYLRAVESTALHRPPPSSPALLWFYGNGETIAAIWPIVREFQPPGTAVLVVDYPGYGGGAGRGTQTAKYGAAAAAPAPLGARARGDTAPASLYGPPPAPPSPVLRPPALFLSSPPPAGSDPAAARIGVPRRRACAAPPDRHRRRTSSSAPRVP